MSTLLNRFGDSSEHSGSALFPRPHPPRRMRGVSLCIPGPRHQGLATQLHFFQGPKGNWARPGKTSCAQHRAAHLLSTTFSNRNKEPSLAGALSVSHPFPLGPWVRPAADV